MHPFSRYLCNHDSNTLINLFSLSFIYRFLLKDTIISLKCIWNQFLQRWWGDTYTYFIHILYDKFSSINSPLLETNTVKRIESHESKFKFKRSSFWNSFRWIIVLKFTKFEILKIYLQLNKVPDKLSNINGRKKVLMEKKRGNNDAVIQRKYLLR